MSEKKKLLVTASTFPRYMEDTEPRFIYDLCKEYCKYYDVTVLVPAAPGALETEIMEGMKVIRYHYFPIHKMETLCYPGAIVPRIKEKKVRGLLVPFLFLAMKRNIKKIINQFDFVHSNWIIPQGIVQQSFDKPYIISGLGGDVTSINKSVVKKLKFKCLSKAKKITVVSKDLKDYIINNFSIKADSIDIIPMGCSLTMFKPENKIENLWNQGNRKVILFVGRLVEKKGAEYLIKAMSGIDAKLVIVGDGPQRENLVKLAASIDADIEFAGSKNKQELKDYYASCDIFCIPSVIAKDGDKDGLPVALVEAMASGAVVVGTAIGGIAEIIEDGVNGIIVKDRDITDLQISINKLLENENMRNTLSKNARISAEKYDFVKIGEQYRDIIDSNLK